MKFCVTTTSFLLMTLSLAAAYQQPSDAQARSFFCGNSKGSPATMAETTRGNVPIIHWVSDYFGSGYSPKDRCELVSAKFQQYYGEGKLKYITTGRQNRQNILCVAEYKDGPCVGTLFTLKPDANPKATLRRLFNISAGKGSGPLFEQRGEYYDVEEFLNIAPVEEN